ncbi:MAG TPA: glycosyltransferase [Gemmatimonadaceae bacterium]|nr:glycosyltransferase [Gemmatimonadaceae bacterium]
MSRQITESPRIAVIVPCYNEEVAIATVVKQFKAALPSATVYVYDNASTDRTSDVARAAGAVVRFEPRKGKGNVVRRMFADVDADIYVMVDGDATYDAGSALEMIDRLASGNLDMVVANRQSEAVAAYRAGHQFGNRLFNRILETLFNSSFQDIFSGYRAFSRRFVKSFPAASTGFDIETELTVHALELSMPVGQIESPYGARPEGSESKLRTYRHGSMILWRIMILYKEVRPFQFFSAIALMLAVTSTVLVYPIVVTYIETGLVPRFPTAILATGLMILAFISITCGLILDSGRRGRREMKHLLYLQQS